MIKSAELRITESLQHFFCCIETVGNIFFSVGVGSNSDDSATKISVKFQNPARWLGVAKSIAVTGGVDFDSLVIPDGLSENFSDVVMYLLKRIDSMFIIPGKKIQMCEDGIAVEYFLYVIDLTVIPLVVFLLRSSSLKILRPEFQIVYLMHGKKNEIKLF